MSKPIRIFVDLDSTQSELLRQLHRDLTEMHRAKNKKAPSMQSVIQGCILTGLHSVYGEDFGYTELLDSETFNRLLAEEDHSGT